MRQSKTAPALATPLYKSFICMGIKVAISTIFTAFDLIIYLINMFYNSLARVVVTLAGRAFRQRHAKCFWQKTLIGLRIIQRCYWYGTSTGTICSTK